MKKLLITAVLLFMLPVFVSAEVIPHNVYAISHNTIYNNDIEEGKEISFQAIGEYQISEIYSIEENSILKLKIDEYVEAKRGKRNGYIKVHLIEFTIPSEGGRIKNVNNDNIYGTLRLSTEKDMKNIAKSAGVSVVGHILKIPGFSQAIAVSKGLIAPNPEQSRLQSAGKNLYESTPLVYGEKGKELKIEEDSIVVIKLKSKESSDE